MRRTSKDLASKDLAIDRGDAACQLAGLTIIALFPALFWTGVLALVGAAVGHPPSAITLVTVGAAIATFLFTVVSTLLARPLS
jgi:hypothetical protein